MKKISLIIPVFNEEKSVYKNANSIWNSLPKNLDTEFEILFINDGSSDQTEQQLSLIQKNNSQIRHLNFTRNFGKESAIIAGLGHSQSDAVIVMDSDLQHPPELIAEMVRYWKKGFLVVEAVKENRGKESFFNKLSAKAFYSILESLSGYSLAGHTDFKLLDREVVISYLALSEKQKFFRGLVRWLGYVSVQIPFSVPEREGGGGSRWSRLKLIKYAVRNISVFSSIPLRFVSFLGFITLVFGFVFGVISLWQKIEGQALTGFTTVNLLIIVMGGAILCCLGIVGHYLALIYEEIKARPQFIIKSDREDINKK